MNNNEVSIREVKNFLLNNSLATISTVTSDNLPQSAVVYYFYLDDGLLFFVTIKDSNKVKNLERNKAIAAVITDAAEKKTLQIEGEGAILSDPDNTVDIITKIYKSIEKNNKGSLNWPLLTLKPNDLQVIQISISWFRYSIFGEETTIIEGTSSDLG